MAGGGVAGGGGDPGRRVSPLFDGGEECGKGVLPFSDDDVVGVLRHFAVAGGGVGAADDRDAICACDLVTIGPFVDGVQAVAGDVGAGAVRGLKAVAVCLACCRERGEGVACRSDLPPVDLHGCGFPDHAGGLRTSTLFSGHAIKVTASLVFR